MGSLHNAITSTDEKFNEKNINYKDKLLMADETYVAQLDADDPLRAYRSQFLHPKSNGKDVVYLSGNSLGLQPIAATDFVNQGHFTDPDPWVTYDEICNGAMARIVGAKENEVILMNSLTVNLHFMLTSFYRPTNKRFKILVEDPAFSSDMIALASNIKLKGYDQEQALLVLKPRPGEFCLRQEDIMSTLSKHSEEIALVFLGGVNYYTGQVFDMKAISSAAKAEGCMVGFDLAHAVGNVKLELHEWSVDFAVWCTYKYLNGGPGGIGGCFVHGKHSKDPELPRLSGWWSHEKDTRFQMKPHLRLREGALGFQVSNPSILCLASLRASLQLYDEVGMDQFVNKRQLLTGYMLDLLEGILTELTEDQMKIPFQIITPANPQARGCQISLLFYDHADSKRILHLLREYHNVIVDFREPNCIRVAPNPLYNTFRDIWNFNKALKYVIVQAYA